MATRTTCVVFAGALVALAPIGCGSQAPPAPMAAPVVDVPGAASSVPAAPVPEAAGADEAAPVRRTRVVCEDERPTGSNIAKRVCRTITETHQAEEGARRDLRRMQGTQAGAGVDR